MCTSLLYTDAHHAPYAGRTMELPMELPYKLAYFAAGTAFQSQVPGHTAQHYTSTHAFISVAVPDPLSKDLKVAEGINTAGLSFSLLAFASTQGPKDMLDKTQSALAAIDLGAWVLGSFATVAQAKQALQETPVLTNALLPLGLLKTPFHYTLHDATGASLVIEFANGQQNLLDNPIGVMTNGPEFQWHLTNLNNYTFLNNKDQSRLSINGVQLQQPDSGIATVALPASNTSVGRFVRAVYYATFAEKAKTPQQAIYTLSHVMNNFDRPRGITVDERFKDGLENMAAPGVNGHPLYISEYTSWTALSDLQQQKFYLRAYNALNYICIDLQQLQSSRNNTVLALQDFHDTAGDITAALR